MCHKVVVFLSFCALLQNVKSERASPKIIGGEIVTDRSEVAYQVSVRVNGKHYCGGALLDDHNVLTAAHCCFLSGTKMLRFESSMEVVFGDLQLRPSSKSTVRKKITKVIPHEHYNPNTFANDIAVLKFSDPIRNWTNNIRPIRIAKTIPNVGTTCVVSGWGRTNLGGPLSNDLQRVHVPILGYSQCTKSYPFSIRHGMFCAGHLKGGKDACQGDSGGPLVTSSTSDNYTLVGIVSWGYSCAKPNFPGVYTDVSYYHEWITAVMNDSTKATLLPYLIVICVSIIKIV